MEDAEEFSHFYEQESEAILRFLARRTMDVEIALELTAETFAIALRAWRKLQSLGPEQRRAWLFTVARRLNGHYLRRARVEQRAVRRLGIQVPDVHLEDIEEIERRCGLRDLRAALGIELSRLSDGQRAALLLRVVEEQPYSEVASRLGISEQTARARVSRGLRALSGALEPTPQPRELS